MSIKKFLVSIIVLILAFGATDINAAEDISMIERLPSSEEFNEIKEIEDKIVSRAKDPNIPREVSAADIDYDHALKFYGDVEIFKQQRSALKEKMTEDFIWLLPVHVDQVTVVVGVAKVPTYPDWKKLACTYDITFAEIDNDFNKYEEEVLKIAAEKSLPKEHTRVVFLWPDADMRNRKAVVLVENQIRYVIPLIDVTISVQNSDQITTKNGENATQVLTAFQVYDYQELNEILLPENLSNQKDGGELRNSSDNFSMIPYLTIGGGILIILLALVVYKKK